MIFRSLIQSIFGLLLGTALLPAAAGAEAPKMVLLEGAIEAESVELLVDPRGVGRAVVRTCAACAPQKLKVTAASKAYSGNKEVPIASATHAGGVMVFYFIKDRTLSRIRY